MRIGANTYKLIFLDTNAIREIVTNINFSGKGFLQKFLSCNSTYGSYAPCFSINNVIELRPYKDIYESFIKYFSIFPCLLIFPAKLIIQEEYYQYTNGQTLKINNNIANAFSPMSDNISYNFRDFISNIESKLASTIQDTIDALPEIATAWEKQRRDAELLLEKMNLAKEIIGEEFYRSQEQKIIIKDLRNWGISPKTNTNILSLPASRIMEYSQFCRVHLTKKPIKPNDVMDIRISCVVPYIDAVITEGFQSNVYRKAKQFIPQLKNLEIYTLKDIRQ